MINISFNFHIASELLNILTIPSAPPVATN